MTIHARATLTFGESVQRVKLHHLPCLVAWTRVEDMWTLQGATPEGMTAPSYLSAPHNYPGTKQSQHPSNQIPLHAHNLGRIFFFFFFFS